MVVPDCYSYFLVTAREVKADYRCDFSCAFSRPVDFSMRPYPFSVTCIHKRIHYCLCFDCDMVITRLSATRISAIFANLILLPRVKRHQTESHAFDNMIKLLGPRLAAPRIFSIFANSFLLAGVIYVEFSQKTNEQSFPKHPRLPLKEYWARLSRLVGIWHEPIERLEIQLFLVGALDTT